MQLFMWQHSAYCHGIAPAHEVGRVQLPVILLLMPQPKQAATHVLAAHPSSDA